MSKVVGLLITWQQCPQPDSLHPGHPLHQDCLMLPMTHSSILQPSDLMSLRSGESLPLPPLDKIVVISSFIFLLATHVHLATTLNCLHFCILLRKVLDALLDDLIPSTTVSRCCLWLSSFLVLYGFTSDINIDPLLSQVEIGWILASCAYLRLVVAKLLCLCTCLTLAISFSSFGHLILPLVFRLTPAGLALWPPCDFCSHSPLWRSWLGVECLDVVPLGVSWLAVRVSWGFALGSLVFSGFLLVV